VPMMKEDSRYAIVDSKEFILVELLRGSGSRETLGKRLRSAAGLLLLLLR
jgi:hypothetical protein